MSLALGSLDVSLPALAARGGAAATAAVPLATFAAASAVVSLWYGTRRWRARAAPLRGGRGRAGGRVRAGRAGRSVWFVAALLVLAGGAYAAVNVVVYELLDRVAPPGAATEAFTWLTAANALGIAVGAVLPGLAGADELGWALALPCVGAGLAAVAAVARPGSLRAAPGSVGRRDSDDAVTAWLVRGRVWPVAPA